MYVGISTYDKSFFCVHLGPQLYVINMCSIISTGLTCYNMMYGRGNLLVSCIIT